MLKGQSIVCFANDFRGDPTSKHQVMRILSAITRCCGFNSIALRRPFGQRFDASRILNKIKSFFRGLDRENDNLHIFYSAGLAIARLRLGAPIQLLAAESLSEALWMRKLGMKDIQLWTFMPTMVELAGRLGEKKLIYYCVDEWSEFSFIDKASIIDMEKRLIEKSDCDRDRGKTLPGQETVQFQHPPDSSWSGFRPFRLGARSEDRRTRGHSGFASSTHRILRLIHEWIDLKTVEAIARAHPEWSIVLIGKYRPTRVF